MEAGKSIIVPEDGTITMQPSLAINGGRMIAEFVDNPIAYGKIYNCGDDRVMTQEQYLDLLSHGINVKPKYEYISVKKLFMFEEV